MKKNSKLKNIQRLKAYALPTKLWIFWKMYKQTL